MAENEKVLVIKRSVLERIGLFQGISFEVDSYLDEIWKGTGASFISRSDAENNPSYKQLIPYVIMSYEDSYLCYIRGKEVDEPRLAEKVSIGIGGHVNPSDNMPPFQDKLLDIYFNAVVREVTEEVIVDSEYEANIVGLINDDSNDVGQVHFGIVHFWRLKKPDVRKREKVICKLQFMKVQELRQIRHKMETWSQLCLDNLSEIASR